MVFKVGDLIEKKFVLSCSQVSWSCMLSLLVEHSNQPSKSSNDTPSSATKHSAQLYCSSIIILHTSRIYMPDGFTDDVGSCFHGSMLAKGVVRTVGRSIHALEGFRFIVQSVLLPIRAVVLAPAFATTVRHLASWHQLHSYTRYRDAILARSTVVKVLAG